MNSRRGAASLVRCAPPVDASAGTPDMTVAILLLACVALAGAVVALAVGAECAAPSGSRLWRRVPVLTGFRDRR